MDDSSDKPDFIVPGGAQSISSSAKIAGKLLTESNRYYIKNNQLVEINNDEFHYISSAQFCSEIERFACVKKRKDFDLKDAVLSELSAKQILASKEFLNQLPKIGVISKCPILTQDNGILIPETNFYAKGGVKIISGDYKELTYEEGINMILEILKDFNFASEADKSRALAAILTPALLLGNILEARSPLYVIEADKSQTGKGYLVKIINAIYNENPSIVTQKKGGVGSLEETFGAHLLKGRRFISFDNIRGAIDSPAIESYMTEDFYPVRLPYHETVCVKTDKTILFMTSNKGEMNQDLVNRSCVIRLLKQPEGYLFRKFPSGDLLDHIRVNQRLYLGAIFAIIKQWFVQGKLKTMETRHDFRAWCCPLDWIVQNLLNQAPLMDSHKETQSRMTNPHQNWFRDVALCIAASLKQSQWIRTNDILEILEENNVEIPGVKENEDMSNDFIRKKALTAMGKRFGKCFPKNEQSLVEILIDKIKVSRIIIKEEQGEQSGPKDVKKYKFSQLISSQSVSNQTLFALDAPESSEENEFIFGNENLSKMCENHKGDGGEEELNGDEIEILKDLEFANDEIILKGTRGHINFPNTDNDYKRLKQLANEGKPSNLVLLQGKKRFIQKTDFIVIINQKSYGK